MAFGETILNMTGTICTELTRRQLDDGAPLVTFSVISNERRFDKQTGGWVDGRKFSVRVKCWRRLADNVAVSLGIGDQVLVAGRLRSTEYEEDGRTRYGLELDAFAVGPNLKNAIAQVRKVRGGGSVDADAEAAAA
ncbi:MAG: single-stranded DNA-binding protein [Haloechinothrix sp.]